MNTDQKAKLIDLINADQLHAAFEILEKIESEGNMDKKISKKQTSEQILKIIAHALNDTDEKVQASAIYMLNKIENQETTIKALLEKNSNIINEAILYNYHKIKKDSAIENLINSTLSNTGSETRSLNLIQAASFAYTILNQANAAEFLATNNDEQITKGAIKALSEVSQETAKDILSILKNNNNNQIKIAIIEKSLELSEEIRQEIILKSFTSNDDTITDSSIQTIQKLSEKEIFFYLSKALKSENIILKLKSGQLIEELSKDNIQFADLKNTLLNDESINSQIKNLNTSPEIQSILNQDQDTNKIMSWLSRQDLGKLPPDIASPLIKKILASGSTEEKVQSINSTYFMPWEASAPLIEIALEDSEKSVRWAATSLLSYLPIAHALPLLAVALQDQDYFVRKESVRGLGTNFSPVTEPLLNRSLKDENEFVRSEAAKYIHKLSKNTEALLQQSLSDSSDKVRSAAAYSLTFLDPTKYKSIMNQAINNSDPKIRGGIAQGITNFKGSRLDKVLDFLIKDSSDVVRRKLFSQLEKIQDDKETLSKLIKKGILDTSSAIRLEALKSSKELSDNEALEIQIKATSDNESLVRSQAIKLIAQNL